jgi:hypothetical protein
MQEEIFGPVGSFAPFETLEEVIDRANDSLYGLAAGVWSSNINTCMAVAEVRSSEPFSVVRSLHAVPCNRFRLATVRVLLSHAFKWLLQQRLTRPVTACMCTRGASSIVIQWNDATRRYAGRRRRYGLGERDDELLGISGALWRPEADGWRPYERQAGPRRVSDLEDRVDQPQRWRAPEAAVVCLVERAEPRQRVGGAVSV